MVMVAIAGALVTAGAAPLRAELIGMGRERSLVRPEIVSSSAIVAFGLTATATLAFALPLGTMTAGVSRLLLYGVLLRRLRSRRA